MYKNLRPILFFLLFISTTIFSQSDIPIGQWQSHLPYQFGRYITQSESTIYYATDWSIVAIDKEERSVDFLSKDDGLSEVGIALIKYDKALELLVVSYDNGIIDLIGNDGITTVADIFNFNNITINKNINDIFITNESIAYIAAGYGISRLDLKDGLFKSTTFTGININSIVVLDGIIYAGTDEGIYSIDSNSAFLEVFDNWTLLDNNINLPLDYSTKAMTLYKEKLFFDVNDSLFTIENNLAKYIYHQDNRVINFLTSEGSNLLMGLGCLPDCGGTVVRFKNDSFIPESPGGGCVDRPLYAIEDGQQSVWFADQFRGIRISEKFITGCSKTVYNSPYSQFSNELAIHENKLYVASSSLKDNGSPRDLPDGFFTFIDGQWTTYNERFVPKLKEEKVIFDYNRVAVRPDNGLVYVGTFQGGLIEWDGEIFNVYNNKNSSLQRADLDTNRVRVTGLAFDKDNNLWVSNHTASKPISVLKNDGTWKSFAVTESRNLLQVAIDDNGYKWFVLGELGVMVFDDGGTIDDISDDRYRVFKESNSTLPTSIVNCLEVDLDGRIWVGTDNGVVEFNCDPFDPECVGGLPIVGENEIDDEDEYLLKGNDVRAIAVDGANRKWFGTTSGLFLQSENGRKEVRSFNEDNSPLLDNIIKDIAINPETGELFIGTDKGIISYRGEATKGGRFNKVNAYAFPNPVRPDYDGPIAIKGLAENANIKITDITGQLIYETTALGGQAIWDGKDYNGRRASTGVYLVFSTKVDLNNPDTFVAKILFVN